MKILWIVCLILAGGCIGLAVRSMLSTNEKSYIKLAKMVLHLAVASFLLYLPVFFLRNNFLTALAADLINVMRVVSLDAGYLDHSDYIRECIGGELFYRLYMAAMGLLHFLMPLLSIMAVYSIFFMFFSHIRVTLINLQKYRPVFIFNTSENNAVLLTADIQKTVTKGAFIFAGIKDKAQRGEVDLLNSAIIHPDNVHNIKISQKGGRDVYYFLLSEDEDTNIQNALDKIDSMSESSKDLQKHTHIYVGVGSNEAECLLDSSSKGEIDIHILRPEEVAVYQLLDDHPLYEHTVNNKISVLVMGMDIMGETLIRAVSWCGQLSGYRLEINVVGIGIAEKISDFKFRYPGYEGCTCMQLNFYDCAGSQDVYTTILDKCKDTTYVVVTEGTDLENTETAIRLRREFLQQDETYNRAPEIFVYIRDKEQAYVVNNLKTSNLNPDRRLSFRLISFGCDEDIYTYENILDSDREFLGTNVYLENELIYDGEEFNVSEALARYNMLEVNKRANIANAMHIRYKLSQLGLDYTRDADACEVDYDKYLTKDKLDGLTRAEHDRWQMFLISEGWNGTDMEDVEGCRNSGMEVEQYFNPLLKVNPFICSFEELEIRSKYLGIKNVADTDREIIMRIPEILHDKWGVLGVSYKIIPNIVTGDGST